MVQRTTPQGHNRNINSTTAKKLTLLAHGQFRSVLSNTAARRGPGCSFYVIDEPWTSKLCSHCGWIHYELGGSAIFFCPNPACRAVVERDFGV
jgi:transposase